MSAIRGTDEIVRQAHSARAALRQARLRLADEARVGAPPALLDPAWDWARRILTSRAPRLRAFPGVVGFALGEKRRGGLATLEPCLVIYVRRKLQPSELRARAWRALPPKVGTGPRAIAVDVVELGDLERHAARPVAALEGHTETLRPACAHPDSSRLAAALMGRLVAGEPVTLPGLGLLRGWRPAVFPGDAGVAVRMSGLASGLQHGVLASPFAHLPGWGLESALLAHIHSTPGDSGSVLVDPENLVLGFLVGRATSAGDGLRVLRPAASVAGRVLPVAVPAHADDTGSEA